MPRYDYECDTCHHVFELRQSFDSEPVANCPKCENSSRRKFHAVPVVFKGSGWYVNDYGKRGSSNSSNTETESAKTESKKSDSGGAEKSETKSETKAKSEATTTSSTSSKD